VCSVPSSLAEASRVPSGLNATAPLLLGSGTVLFDGAGPELEHLDTVDTPEATHVTYRVLQATP
jgi:hypothetical protein